VASHPWTGAGEGNPALAATPHPARELLRAFLNVFNTG
jgi:hypothetical protein